MNKLSTGIIAVLSLIALSQRHSAGPPETTGQEPPRGAIVGAYDSAHINGIVFIANERNIFGLRFLTYRAGDAVEDAPQSYEFGDCAPDGSFARLIWRSRFDDKAPLILRWSRVGDNVVVGQLSAPSDIRVAIEAYRPWSDMRDDLGRTAFYAQDDRRTIFGEEVSNQKASPPLRNFLLQTDRVGSGAAEYGDPQAMRAALLKEGYAAQPESKQSVARFSVLSFDSVRGTPPSPQGAPIYSVGFVAIVGDDFGSMQAESNNLLQKLASGILDQEEKKYESSRVASGGALGPSLTTLSRALNWSRIYLPEKRLEYIALSRRNDRDPSNAPLSWDTFFNAVVSSPVNDASAAAAMRLLLDGLTPDGRAPLRRYLRNPTHEEAAMTAGRSMPPIGALCVWKVYLLTRDLEFLAWAYPRLRQWNDWRLADRGDGQAWRDGNGDGLLEWGFDAELELGKLGARAMSNETKQRLAFSESGLEDRPQGSVGAPAPGAQPSPSVERGDEPRYNDKTHTLEYSTVGLNALYALDTEILMIMAGELGLQAEVDKWRTRYDQIKKNVNEKMWSEEDGLYLNRHWDGSFSRRLSPENFYPLAAGLADGERAKRMMATLLDSKKFWGEYPLPTISRDDPAFAAAAPGRGAIWAPMNYLVYLGLKRYGYHAEAAELARKALAIARSASEKTGRYDDQFSSADGSPVVEGSGAEGDGQRTYFFGLMIWPAIEEAFSADPWAGLSFGSVAATEESRLERLDVSGAKFDVITGPKRTVIRRNGETEVECETPVRLRAYQSNERAIGFVIEAKERAHIMVPASKGRKITVSVDDQVLGSAPAGAAATFKVSEGSHKVLIVK
ncbi:MAG TPA: trehalase family glycosidase [Blastocatellia bacterium]|nr:trehalase family glycosidase [Blastocatellia bacterium]